MTVSVASSSTSRREAARTTSELRGPEQILIDEFEVLASQARGVKLIRDLILDRAMHGDLVDSQGSADPLVTQVRRAREAMTERGLRVRALPPLESLEQPWAVPAGWRWVRLADLGVFLGGGTPSKANASFWQGPLPWVSPKDMKRPYIDDAEDHISEAALEASAAKLIPGGSILCVLRGMILAHSFPVALTTREVSVNQDMKALVLAVPELGEFVLRALQAARARVLAAVERSSHGTCRLDGGVIENLLIPLPPLAEQKRIVAKVDQLMALCDELEGRQTKQRELGNRLTKSALGALTTAETREDFDAAWKRVVENFDVLIDRPEQVDRIRTIVLALATTGALVRRRASSGVDGLPSGWAWRRVDDVGEVKLGKMRSPQNHDGDYLRPYLRVANVLEGRIDTRDVRSMNFPPVDAERYALAPNDILLNEGQSLQFVGRPAIYRGEVPGACFQKTLIRFRCGATLLPEFALIVFRTYMRNGRFQRAAVQTTNMAHLPLMRLVDIEFPLPPLVDQKQIVVTVDHLMKSCAALEAALSRWEAGASRLVAAVVRELME